MPLAGCLRSSSGEELSRDDVERRPLSFGPTWQGQLTRTRPCHSPGSPRRTSLAPSCLGRRGSYAESLGPPSVARFFSGSKPSTRVVVDGNAVDRVGGGCSSAFHLADDEEDLIVDSSTSLDLPSRRASLASASRRRSRSALKSTKSQSPSFLRALRSPFSLLIVRLASSMARAAS